MNVEKYSTHEVRWISEKEFRIVRSNVKAAFFGLGFFMGMIWYWFLQGISK